MKWPHLWQKVEKKELLYIDYYFAEKVCPNGNETEAAFVATLMARSRKGDICMPAQEGAKAYPSIIEECNGNFYLQRNYVFETSVLNEVKRLLSFPCRPQEIIEGAMTEEQKRAVNNAFQYPLSLITGGPGTGKSYTALQIIEAFQKKGAVQIVIGAPTGKAVRLLESKCNLTNVRSGTLHTLLKVRSVEELSKEVELLKADLVIVDECSMVDAPLFSRLLQSIGPNTHLVLMGDPDQLPAVESGSFFSDLIECPIPRAHLTLCLRSDQSEILNLASTIRNGREDFCHYTSPLSDEILWKEIKENFPFPTQTKPDEKTLIKQMGTFRLLSAMRKGPQGVDTLNQKIADWILNTKKADDYCPLPIMITRNDQQTGLFNGETGFLIKTPHQEEEYALFDEGRVFSKYQLPPYEYAYALSVHKSQGSEYDRVVILVPEGSDCFGKELLYTAVTRAKKSVEIYASKEMIKTTLGQSSRKMSGLTDRLKKEIARI